MPSLRQLAAARVQRPVSDSMVQDVLDIADQRNARSIVHAFKERVLERAEHRLFVTSRIHRVIFAMGSTFDDLEAAPWHYNINQIARVIQSRSASEDRLNRRTQRVARLRQAVVKF